MEIIEVLEQINSFLDQSFVFKTVKALLGFYMVVIVLVLLGILFRTGKTYWTVLISGQEFPNITKGKLQKRWEDILVLVNSNNPSSWKAAILESAQMLDEILKTIQYPGENLGERLNGMVEIQLKNLEQVKQANKIKNRIVQEDGFNVSKEEAQKIVEIFGDAMKFFEVIY